MRKYYLFVIIITILIISIIFLYSSQQMQSSEWEQITNFESANIADISWHPNNNDLAVILNRVPAIYSIEMQSYNFVPNVTGVDTITWANNGNQLLFGGDEIWVMEENKVTIQLEGYSEYRVFSDITWIEYNNQIVATSSGLNQNDNLIWVWDAETYDLVQTISGDNSVSTSSQYIGFTDIMIITNSDFIIVDSLGNNAERIWNISTGSPLGIDGFNQVLSSSHDGIRIAGANQGAIQIRYLIADLDPILIPSQQDSIDFLVWNSDNTLLASVSNANSTLEIWDTNTNALLTTLPTSNNVKAISWNPTQNYLAVIDNNRVIVWDIDSETDDVVFSDTARIIEWSDNGLQLAVVSSRGISVFEKNH